MGKYQLLETLGDGGMARVYRARTAGIEGFEKYVALKCLHRELAGTASLREMFVHEARLMAKLSHPNIIQVFELGVDHGLYYMVMELVDGVNLRQFMESVAPPRDEGLVLAIAVAVLDALAYAHVKTDNGVALGIVHRDVNPSNILVSRTGEVKLTDFGIAKVAQSHQLTRTGVLKGKYAYMAPEQARGKPVDARSDQFAAALVVFELLTGRRAFPEDEDMALLERARNADVVWPDDRHLRSAREVLRRALARSPDDRFASVGEFRSALQAALRQRPALPEAIAAGVPPRPELATSGASRIDKTPIASHGVQTMAAQVPSMQRPHRRQRVIVALGLVSAAVLLTVLIAKKPSPPAALPVQERTQVAPPPAPPPASSMPTSLEATGLLTVNAHPWARVYLDGKWVGDTPVEKKVVTAGRHALKLVNPYSQKTIVTQIVVKANEPVTRIFEM